MINSDQVSRVLEPVEGEEETQPDDGISPLMPFPTAMVIDRDMESEMVTWAMTRKKELESETGRDLCGDGEWWNGMGISSYDPLGATRPEHSWMGKRVLFDKTFKNEMDFRPEILGGIFLESNLVVPIARRICRQMIARAIGYFFGTSPWFSILPVGAMDKDRADKADRYLKWKVEGAKLQRVEEQCVERAFVLGESVCKTTWKRKERIYRTWATVLVDEQGKDILDSRGDYITENDLWVQDSSEDPETGEVITSELMLLKRDGKTPQPETLIWEHKLVTRRRVIYNGPESKVMHTMDLLAPLNAETLQDADCVVHLFDREFMEIADEWMKAIPADSTAEDRLSAKRKAVNLLRKLSTSTHNSSAQNSDAVDASSGGGTTVSQVTPKVKVAEFYLRYDVDGDGILEEVFLVVDTESQTPIFYDYLDNITPDGLRPFSVVRVNEIPGRWYGMGAMEMMNPSQNIIDLWMNRKNKAVSGSGRIDLWSPHNTLEGRNNPHLEVGWGGTWTPLPNKSAKDIIESVYLEDNIGDSLMEMIQFVMQLMTLESGVANANDGNAAGLDTTKLATGVNNIEKSGQELFSLFLGHLDPGVSDILKKNVSLIMVNLDSMEVYRYFEEGEGGEGSGEFRQIDPGDIANLEVDTKVLMTKSRSESVLESNIRSISVVKDYFAQPYEVQVQTRQMFIDVLKSLQIQNADKVIVPTQVMVPPVGGGMPDPTSTANAMAPQPRQAALNLGSK